MAGDNHEKEMLSTLYSIRDLLAKSLDLQNEIRELTQSVLKEEAKGTQTISDLLEHAVVTSALAGERTEMAKERTALVREQTRLSTRSTELSVVRTDMSHERTEFAGQRTNLAVFRTDLSRNRTSLADQRTKMAENRTEFSQKRTFLAGTRTILSNMRTGLAHGRTQLALIRTGLAFLSLSIAFFRMFGISWWSIFDGALGLLSIGMTIAGIKGYLQSSHSVKRLQARLPAEEATGD